MINSVRNTTLSVLNKNNYGYISPSDFNLYAANAQMELFVDLFKSYNNSINMINNRALGTNYADLLKNLEETIEKFLVTSTILPISNGSNKFNLPSYATTGYNCYMINKILCYTRSGDTRVFNGEAEKVNNSIITMLVNSNLTSPTSQYPSYSQYSNTLNVYPSGINELDVQYFRYPKTPKWTYITLSNGEPVFNQSQPDYQDFELPEEYEHLLCLKILEYSGVSIRETTPVQFAMAKEQPKQNTNIQ